MTAGCRMLKGCMWGAAGMDQRSERLFPLLYLSLQVVLGWQASVTVPQGVLSRG